MLKNIIYTTNIIYYFFKGEKCNKVDGKNVFEPPKEKKKNHLSLYYKLFYHLKCENFEIN